ncbi:MAG: DUF2804 domain-containing protein [Candidatus Sericytochromatia bacterium]
MATQPHFSDLQPTQSAWGWKRWIYLHFAGENGGHESQWGVAWVDTGYAVKIFAHLSPARQRAQSWQGLSLGKATQPLRAWSDGGRLGAYAGQLALACHWDAGGGRAALSLPQAGGLRLDWQQTRPWLHAQGLFARGRHQTWKTLALPARARWWEGRKQRFERGWLSLDFSAGYPPYQTRWHWASLQGAWGGFNLVEGFLGAAECAFWENDACHALSEGRFERPQKPLALWRLASVDRRLELAFQPRSLFRERLWLGPIATDLWQVYGHYQGHWRLPSGVSLALERVAGVAEYQNTRW